MEMWGINVCSIMIDEPSLLWKCSLNLFTCPTLTFTTTISWLPNSYTPKAWQWPGSTIYRDNTNIVIDYWLIPQEGMHNYAYTSIEDRRNYTNHKNCLSHLQATHNNYIRYPWPATVVINHLLHVQFVVFRALLPPWLCSIPGSTNMASLGTMQLICDAEQCEVQVSQVTPLSVAAMFEVCYIEQCYIPLASPWHIILYTDWWSLPLCFLGKGYFR